MCIQDRSAAAASRPIGQCVITGAGRPCAAICARRDCISCDPLSVTPALRNDTNDRLDSAKIDLHPFVHSRVCWTPGLR